MKNNDIDPIKLLNDLEYSVDWHHKILKNKMKMCSKLGDEAWSCYNSATPRHRKAYVKKVNRYYKGDK